MGIPSCGCGVWPVLVSLAMTFASTDSAAQLRFQSISPNNPRPGDLADVRFTVDGGAPSGFASVWVNRQRRCNAVASGGEFACTMRVPFGGKLPLELRFTPPVGEAQTAIQTVDISGIAIVKTQPEEPVLGRSALFFVNLESNNRLSAVQPTGHIRIVDEKGTEQCRVLLPAQSFCQALMLQAGRQDYTAIYSGDPVFPEISSTPFGVLTRQLLTETNLYRSADPSTLSVPERSSNLSFESKSLNADFERLVGLEVINPRVGISQNRYALFNSTSTSGLARLLWQSENSVISRFLTTLVERGPRDQLALPIKTAELRASFADRSMLIETTDALVPADNNARLDLYLRRGNEVLWLSQRADGSAAPDGVAFLFSNEHGVAFSSVSSGFVASDQDTLADVFILSENQPLRRLALDGRSAVVTDISARGDAVLLTSRTALSGEVVGAESNAYRWTNTTGQFVRLSNLEGAPIASVQSAIFAPDLSAVLRYSTFTVSQIVTQTVWKPLIGPAVTLPNVNPLRVRDDYTLIASSGSILEYNLLSGASNEHFFQQRGDVRILNRRVHMDASGSIIASTNGNAEVLIDATVQTELTNQAFGYALSADGAQLYFSTTAPLLPEDTNAVSDVYRRDRATNALTLLSRLPNGARPQLGVTLFALSPQHIVYSVQMSELGQVGQTLAYLRLNLLTNQVSLLAPAIENCLVANFQRVRYLVRRCASGKIERVDVDSNAVQTLIETMPDFRPSIFGVDDTGTKAALSFFGGGSSFGATAHSLEYWDFSTGAKKLIDTSVEDRFVGLVSHGGRYVLYLRTFQSNISPPPGPTPVSTLLVYDSQTEQSRELSIGVTDFAWSDDGCNIAVTDLSVGLRTLANPFCKALTQTTITSTTPVEPNWAQPYVVETEVTANDLGTPTGIVRIQGFGGQCDAPIRAQGGRSLASCVLNIGRNDSLPFFFRSLCANYLGDQIYSGSTVRVSKTPVLQSLAMRLEVEADSDRRAAVRVRAVLRGVVPGQRIRGHVALVAGSKTAFLNADQLARGDYVSFVTEGTILSADLVDPHYLASTNLLLNPADLFASGFEAQ